MIAFEFDVNKSQSNLKKHGIDFVSAQQLWNDPDLLEIPAKTVDEPRYVPHTFFRLASLGALCCGGRCIPYLTT